MALGVALRSRRYQAASLAVAIVMFLQFLMITFYTKRTLYDPAHPSAHFDKRNLIGFVLDEYFRSNTILLVYILTFSAALLGVAVYNGMLRGPKLVDK